MITGNVPINIAWLHLNSKGQITVSHSAVFLFNRTSSPVTTIHELPFSSLDCCARHLQDTLMEMSTIFNAQILPVIEKGWVLTLKCLDKWVHLENNHFFVLFNFFLPVSPAVTAASGSDLWPFSNRPTYWEVERVWDYIRYHSATQNKPLWLCQVCATQFSFCVCNGYFSRASSMIPTDSQQAPMEMD